MKKRKIYKIILLFIIALLVIILGYMLLHKDKGSITFKEVKIIEYGDETITSKDFVKSVTGKITFYPKIDVMKTGKQTLVYRVSNEGAKTDVPFTITIKDTQKPTITLKQSEVTISLGATFDASSNIYSIIDNVDGSLIQANSEKKNTYTIGSNVDTSKEGTYQVEIKAIDKNNNKITKSFDVHVVKEPTSAIESNTEIVPTYIKGILIVNKIYGLPQSFGETDPSAYSALQLLQEAAAKEGYHIPTLSGYRSYDTQVTLYNNYVARDGQAAADRYSARPGYSEHQSGLCFDIGSIDDDYGSTPAGQWLNDNCAKYGYIIRYPNGKENITGYMYEPWHVRYVGIEVATEIMKNESTLEEYLGV